MQEIWKDIPGFEGIYQISNYGNARSFDRRVVNHRGGTTRIAYGKKLTPWDNGNGYLVLTIHDGKKRKNCYVHRLVAELFLDKPRGKEYVNHIDYNKHNNNVENLEWCTQKENTNHSIENMRKPHKGAVYIIEKCRCGKITYELNIKGIKVRKCFKTYEEAEKARNEIIQTHSYFTRGREVM